MTPDPYSPIPRFNDRRISGEIFTTPIGPALPRPLALPMFSGVIFTGQRTSTQCPACRDVLYSAPTGRCKSCGTVHHLECLSEIGCASLACTPGGERDDAPPAAPPDHPFIACLRHARYSGAVPFDADDDAVRIGFPADDADLSGVAYLRIPHTYSPSWGGEESAIDESNRIEILREFGGRVCFCDELGQHCDGHPYDRESDGCSFLDYEHAYMIARVLPEPCGCRGDDEDPWACENAMVSVLEFLDGHSILDEDTMGQLEQARIDEAWDDHGRRDLLESLQLNETADAALDEAEDHMGTDAFNAAIDDAFRYVCCDEGEYPSYDRGDVRWPWDSGWTSARQGFRQAFREAIGIDEFDDDDEDDSDDFEPTHHLGDTPVHVMGSGMVLTDDEWQEGDHYPLQRRFGLIGGRFYELGRPFAGEVMEAE